MIGVRFKLDKKSLLEIKKNYQQLLSCYINYGNKLKSIEIKKNCYKIAKHEIIRRKLKNIDTNNNEKRILRLIYKETFGEYPPCGWY